MNLNEHISIRILPRFFWIAALCWGGLSLPNERAFAMSGRSNIQDQTLIFESSLQKNRAAIPTVISITQDQKGYIWLGTISGMVRFDGYEYKVFRTTEGGKGTNKTSLKNDWVSAMYFDGKSRLWVGTKAGLQQFDLETEQFTDYALPTDHNNGSKPFSIGQIIEDLDGNLWFSSDKGLLRRDEKSGEFTLYEHRSNDPSSLSSNRIHALMLDRHGDLWIGTEKGLDILRKHSKDFEHTILSSPPSSNAKANKHAIWSLTLDHEDRVWVGLPNQLAYFHLSQAKKSTLVRETMSLKINYVSHQELQLEADGVMKILETRNHDLWVATRNSGLFRKQKGSNNFVRHQRNSNDPYSLCDNEIFSLFEDKYSVLWIGTWNGGACHTDLFNTGFKRIVENKADFPSVSAAGVRNLVEDRDGDIISVTVDGSVNIIDKKSSAIRSRSYIQNNSDRNRVHSIVIDRSGNTWFISPKGIRPYDKSKMQFGSYIANLEHQPMQQIFCAMVDRDGEFWITTENGVFVYSPGDGAVKHLRNNINQKNSLANDFVYPIVQDQDGIIWMGTPTGLQRYDKEKNEYRFYTHEIGNSNSVANGNITALFVDRFNILWIGSNYHLTRAQFDKNGNGVFRSYSTIALVNSILESMDSKLWISTDSGISSFDRNTDKFRDYFESDGITRGVFRSEVKFAGRDGKLYFGGPNGITQIDPRAIGGNPFSPDATITGLNFLNQPSGQNLSEEVAKQISKLSSEEIQLPYSLNSFTVNFTALHFSRPEANTFMYHLKGFDNTWRSSTASNRSATYTNLPSGVYEFFLRAANKDGVWSHEERKLMVRIMPPMWQVWWVQCLILLLCLTFVWFIHWLRVRHLTQRKDLLEREVEIRTQVISQQNKDKSKFIADAAHDLRQPMQAIGNLLDASANALKAQNQDRAFTLINMALKATNVMRSSFNTILELSRLETGLVSPEYETLDIHTILEDIINTLYSAAVSHGVKIHYKKSKQHNLFVESDKHILTRVISNIVSNAIKYCDESKSHRYVLIRCVHREGTVGINVIDNGIGVPLADQSNIFKAFFQIGNANRDRDRGLGLGLSIVNASMQLLAGHKLAFRSRLNFGTRFLINIPRAKRSTLKQVDNHAPNYCQHSDMRGIFVIHIEDDMLVRNSIKTVFTDYGVICASFESYAELVGQLDSFERIPDIILTDHILSSPHQSDDIINDLRAHFDFRIPAIILTGESIELPTTSKLVADHILHKPASTAEIIAAIEKLRPEMISNSALG